MEMQLHDAFTFVAPLATSALMLAALHWFPWHGGSGPLSRTSAYTLGTLVTVGIPAGAMLLAEALGVEYGQTFWAVLLLANAAASGATVHLAYWIDERSRPVTLDDVREAQNAPKRY